MLNICSFCGKGEVYQKLRKRMVDVFFPELR